VDRQHKIEPGHQALELPLYHVQIQNVFDSLNPSIDEMPSSVLDIDPVKEQSASQSKRMSLQMQQLTGIESGKALLVSRRSFWKKLMADVLHSRASMRK
jgi:hypothetical protein